MNTPQTAVIALGSNLDHPSEKVQAALQAIDAHPQIAVQRISSLYRTAPVGYADQPDFINAVCLVDTTLSAQALLAALHDIEAAFGRERSFRNAPRTLDLDIIDYAHCRYSSDALTLPHPRAHERSFVMLPRPKSPPIMRLAATARPPGWLSAWAAAASIFFLHPFNFSHRKPAWIIVISL